ncbi:MAG: methyltransferase domain-containing protein [Acidimicrobiales bacterium]
MAKDRYSHGHHESVLRSHRWRTAENSAGFLLPHLRSNMTVLDVGCGPGNITADLAKRLDGGSIVGIDLAGEIVNTASSNYSKATHPNLSFQVGDVYGLSFDDGSFEVVYAHQVLQHLGDPVRALAEMQRVLRSGGILAVRDADYGAFVWHPADPQLTRWMDVYHQITMRNGATADAGRHLKEWVRAAGFADVAVSSSTWTFESSEERAWWGGLWAERVRHSEFARQGIEYAITNEIELEAMACAFERWSDESDGVFIVVHGEVLARR